MATTDTARRSDLPGSLESVEDDLTSVGKRLAWARLRKRMTQMDLSKLVDKSRATIVQYEMDNTNPPIEVIAKLGEIFNLPPEFIAFGRHGIDGIKGKGEMVPISEIKVGRDADLATGGHALSRKMLEDFGIEENKQLEMFVLDRAAPAFDMKAGTRVLVSEADNTPSREFDLYLIRSGEGLDVIRLETSLTADVGQITVTTGNGRTVDILASAIDFVGAIVSSIRPHTTR